MPSSVECDEEATTVPAGSRTVIVQRYNQLDEPLGYDVFHEMGPWMAVPLWWGDEIIGTFGIANNLFNVWLMLGCALVGYFFIKVGVEPAPLLLGLVLGPQLEENFRRAMLLADGDFSVFLRRPISATLLAIVAILFLLMVFPAIRRSRQQALAE